MNVMPHAMGQALDRLDGPDKVQGQARYAFEYPVDRPAYLFPVQATIAVGRITAIDTARGRRRTGGVGRAHPCQRSARPG